MNRRTFLRTAIGGVAAAAVGGSCYGFFEAGWIRIDNQTLPVPRLPRAFQGTRIAFLTDIHHGPYTDLGYIQTIVRTTNLLQPDLVLLGGDYSLRDAKYIAPCIDLLGELRAPMGVYGVLGNHDYWHGIEETHDALKAAKITELTNAGHTFTHKGERFCLAGVDDLWRGQPDLRAALKDVQPHDACLLLAHNPDYCETLTDKRVGLVLSGHTHGGQVVFPGGVTPFVPSYYGEKYRHGLVQAPETQVYVSRGLGTAMVPVRAACRPEINVITVV